MKKCKVLLNFVKLPISKKIMFYKNVISCLNNHPDLVSPDVTIDQLTAKVDVFENDYQQSMGGEYVVTARMHESKSAADDIFREVALFVDKKANGDEVVIIRAGFSVSKQPVSYNKPILQVRVGKAPGQALLICKKIAGAKAYLWQYYVGEIPENENDWILAGASTQVQFLVKNLTSVTRCWFRRAPITNKGIETWCAPVMKLIP